MDRKEQLHELHLALEGAVEQLGAAHRIASASGDPPDPELDRVFADVVGIRNRVRESLMKEMARPPTIRKGPKK